MEINFYRKQFLSLRSGHFFPDFRHNQHFLGIFPIYAPNNFCLNWNCNLSFNTCLQFYCILSTLKRPTILIEISQAYELSWWLKPEITMKRLFLLQVDWLDYWLLIVQRKIFLLWVSDCCLTPTQLVLAPWKNSPRIDMSPHSDTLFWFWDNKSLLFLLNAACLANKQQILILVFGLTWPRLELTINHTGGKQANHYTTDAIIFHLWVDDILLYLV